MQFLANSKQKGKMFAQKRMMADLQDEKIKDLSDELATISMQFQNELIINIIPHIGQFRDNFYSFILQYESNYPFNPPKILTVSTIPHPNINLKKYELSLSILDIANWKPTYGLYEILQAIKQTILYIDFTYIPNDVACIKSAQRLGKLDHSTDEEEMDDHGFEITQNFIKNFELPNRTASRISVEQDQSDGTDDDMSSNRYYRQHQQEPSIINLVKNKSHTKQEFQSINQK